MIYMTNYFRIMIAATVLCAGASVAAETPAKPAAHYLQAATGASLTFTFTQADATNHGAFGKFSTELVYDDKNPVAGKLDVTVQIASLDTQDQDRDDTLKSEDLMNVAKFPTAHYSASIQSTAGDLVAVGKLTLRGVTRDLRIPVKIQSTGGGVTISGETAIKRLDFGIGRGEWKATDTVGDEVKLQFKVPLVPGG